MQGSRERSRSRSRDRLVAPCLPMEPISVESDDFQGGSKKVPPGVSTFLGNQSLIPRVEEWMQENGVVAKPGNKANMEQVGGVGQEGGMRWKSFKHAVLNGKEVEEEVEEDWWSGECWKDRVEVIMTKRGPNVVFSPAEKARLAAKWKNAVIIKLLGRMINPDYLEGRVQALWAKHGVVDTIDIGSGFFVVQFTEPSDY